MKYDNLMDYFEKPPLKSKKWIAYLIAEATWKLLIVVALLVMKDQIQTINASAWWFMITIVVVAGFMEAMYIGGQAALDRYMRVAQIAAAGPGGRKQQGDHPDEQPSGESSGTNP